MAAIKVENGTIELTMSEVDMILDGLELAFTRRTGANCTEKAQESAIDYAELSKKLYYWKLSLYDAD